VLITCQLIKNDHIRIVKRLLNIRCYSNISKINLKYNAKLALRTLSQMQIVKVDRVKDRLIFKKKGTRKSVSFEIFSFELWTSVYHEII